MKLLSLVALALLVPLAVAAETQEAKRYRAGAVWAECSLEEPEGRGGACFLAGGWSGARITLADDVLGVVPSSWAAFPAGGPLLARGDFCGAVDAELPPGTVLLFVHVDTTLRVREGCPLPTQPVYGPGTVTVMPRG